MRYIKFAILILLFSCTKQTVEPVTEKESTYSFEVVTPNVTSIRFTTDMKTFTDINHTGNWKYEWKQLPSTHKPITFQVGIFQCCLQPVTLLIKQNGKTLVGKTITSTQYSIAY